MFNNYKPTFLQIKKVKITLIVLINCITIPDTSQDLSRMKDPVQQKYILNFKLNLF